MPPITSIANLTERLIRSVSKFLMGPITRSVHRYRCRLRRLFARRAWQFIVFRQGEWRRVESPISFRFSVQFVHGMCDNVLNAVVNIF